MPQQAQTNLQKRTQAQLQPDDASRLGTTRETHRQLPHPPGSQKETLPEHEFHETPKRHSRGRYGTLRPCNGSILSCVKYSPAITNRKPAPSPAHLPLGLQTVGQLALDRLTARRSSQPPFFLFILSDLRTFYLFHHHPLSISTYSNKTSM